MIRAVLLLGLAACSGFIDNKAASSTLHILEASQVAARRQSDLELARAAMPGGIIQLEAFAIAYPKRPEFRRMHAGALCDYAAAFVFDDWEDASLGGRTDEATRIATRLTSLLAQCRAAQLELLPPAYRTDLAAQLPDATRAEVPALLAIARADAQLIALAPMAHAAQLPAVETMLRRCVELWPGYHDADGELLLGTLEAATSRFFGGPDGTAAFAAARRLGGDGNLIVDVMVARAIAKKDKAQSDMLLHRVVDVDLSKWPDRRLANELARKKAARYLADRPSPQ